MAQRPGRAAARRSDRLIVGIWWHVAGLAAAAGLVVYFAVAVAFHILSKDTAHMITPAVLAGVAAAVLTLQVVSL